MNCTHLPRLAAVLAVILAAPPTSAAMAQTTTSPSGMVAGDSRPTLTLADALRMTVGSHPLLIDAAGRRLMRVGSASERAAFPNPHLEWRREGMGAASPTDEFITAVLPIDITGRRFIARSGARATDRSAVADSQAVANTVIFEAARAYHRAALGSSLQMAAERQRTALVEIARYDSTRWREGAASEGAALRTGLEADRGRAKAALVAVDAERLHSALAVAIGVAADSLGDPIPLGVAATLPALPALPILDSLQSVAIAQRPELRAARAAVDAAERRVTVERLAAVGDVSIGGGTRNSGGDRGGTISVGMSIPLLNRNGPARQIAQGELLQARAVLRQAELQVRAEVATAAAAYERLRNNLLPLAPGAGARGAEVAQIVQAAYREGGATLFELLDAQRAAAELDEAALRWLTDLQLARLDLLQAIGEQLPEAF